MWLSPVLMIRASKVITFLTQPIPLLTVPPSFRYQLISTELLVPCGSAVSWNQHCLKISPYCHFGHSRIEFLIGQPLPILA